MALIRIAAIGDAPFIQNLNLEALGYSFPIESTERRLAAILKKPEDRVFVAEIGGDKAGYIHACTYDVIYREPLKAVVSVAVSGAFRRMGIGRLLLEAVEGWAREEGSYGVRLLSSSYRAEAHLFYASCGFSEVKEQKQFFKALE